jgi:peptidyl-prolyl cis-trans isomerase D
LLDGAAVAYAKIIIKRGCYFIKIVAFSLSFIYFYNVFLFSLRRRPMLKFMRTHATSWFIKIILTLIIVVFIFWGIGSIKNKGETVVATVGGQHIDRVDFDRTYRDVSDAYTKNYVKLTGKQISPDVLKGLNIKEQALDYLINAAIIDLGVSKMGMDVSNEELRDFVVHDPRFQRGGEFDRDLYEEFLRTKGVDDAKFLSLVRGELMSRHLAYLIQDTAVIVTDDEVKELFFLMNEKINLRFVRVSPSAFINRTAVTPTELEQYYAEHKEEYRSPAQVKVIYLRFSPEVYRKEVKISPQEIQAYYDTNRDQYQRPERMRVRHILIRVGPEASAEMVQKARGKAEQILAEARRGTSFDALARQYSDDPSASRGGDLGYIPRDQVRALWGNAVMNLHKGEISPLVKTRYGFHIVKVEEVQAGRKQTLEAARGEITAAVLQEKAQEIAAIHAADASYQARNKKGGLKSYAHDAGLKVGEAGPFRGGEPAAREKIPSMAFSLEKGDISSPFQDGKDYIVLEVVDKMPPQILPLDKVKEQVRTALVSSLAKTMAQGVAQQLLQAGKKGQGFQELLTRYGLKIEETGFFKRSSTTAPSIGPLGAYSAQIATLTMEDPWLQDTAEINNAFVVPKLQGVERGEAKGFDKAADLYRKWLAARKGEVLLQRWLAVKKKEVKIDINEELLGKYR